MQDPKSRRRSRSRGTNSDSDRAYSSRQRSSRKEERTKSRVDSSGDEDSRRHQSRRDIDGRRERRDRAKEDRTGDDRHSSRRSYRERSRSRDRRDRGQSNHRHRSRSPKSRRRDQKSASPPPKRSRGPLPSQDESFRGELPPGERPPEKQKPNFKPTGLLAKEANTVEGTTTVLKYHEPAEARKPSNKEQWRMYVFKKKDMLDTIQLYTRSAWLCGRDQKVTDLYLEHPSISKQHAVIQFRHRTTTNEFGDKISKVKPYIIDLESANGTKLNGKKIETSKYMELLDQDVISFGDSEREYVMMLPGAEK